MNMDDWGPGTDHRGELSPWRRVQGEGEPTDRSPGWSGALDRPPSPQPQDIPPDLRPDPVPAVFTQAFAQDDATPTFSTPAARPATSTPTPQRYSPVDPIGGARAYLSRLIKGLEQKLEDPDR